MAARVDQCLWIMKVLQELITHGLLDHLESRSNIGGGGGGGGCVVLVW